MKTALLLLALGTMGIGLAPSPTPLDKVSFVKQVQPILKKNCIGCHNEDQAKKGLDLSSYEGLMKGTRNGKVVVAGKSEDSVIIKSIKGLPGGSKMPPKRDTKLKDSDVKTIADWIDQGAEKN